MSQPKKTPDWSKSKPFWAGFEAHDTVKCPTCSKMIPGHPDASGVATRPFQKTCECGASVIYSVSRAYTPTPNTGGGQR